MLADYNSHANGGNLPPSLLSKVNDTGTVQVNSRRLLIIISSTLPGRERAIVQLTPTYKQSTTPYIAPYHVHIWH